MIVSSRTKIKVLLNRDDKVLAAEEEREREGEGCCWWGGRGEGGRDGRLDRGRDGGEKRTGRLRGRWAETEFESVVRERKERVGAEIEMEKYDEEEDEEDGGWSKRQSVVLKGRGDFDFGRQYPTLTSNRRLWSRVMPHRNEDPQKLRYQKPSGGLDKNPAT
ncbi:hypothetical protein ONZ45_g4712 [Pleurotus djamor]|nr:hypothetical protein ONZ45_g4712 [Pleurotus djamor]